jgi:uncharacterized protein (UPF0276 family)
LGLGASLSLSAKPEPVSLCQKVNGPQFVEYAGLSDVAKVFDEVAALKAQNIPVLFHPSFINFCGSFTNSPVWLAQAKKHIEQVDSPWFAQDCAYCFWQESFGYSSQFAYFIPPILNKASLALAIDRVKEVQEAVARPVAIEPPPVTFIAGTIPVLDFFAEVTDKTDCAILLDMGHLVSYEMAGSMPMLESLANFPVERVIELHVAGGKLMQGEQDSIYIDAHEKNVLDETWAMFDELLPKLPQVKAVCFECEGVAEDKVLNTLAVMREKIIAHSASEALVKKVCQ